MILMVLNFKKKLYLIHPVCAFFLKSVSRINSCAEYRLITPNKQKTKQKKKKIDIKGAMVS